MKLGPIPKRLDLYVTKGTKWSKILRFPDGSGGYLDLTGYTFTGKIRKTYDSPTAYDFSFTAITETEREWSLPVDVSATMPAGCNDQDPASRYVYDVLLTIPGNPQACIIKGLLTLNPKAS